MKIQVAAVQFRLGTPVLMPYSSSGQDTGFSVRHQEFESPIGYHFCGIDQLADQLPVKESVPGSRPGTAAKHESVSGMALIIAGDSGKGESLHTLAGLSGRLTMQAETPWFPPSGN